MRLLVLGGSRGALRLNQVIVEALAKMPSEQRPLLWHQTGSQHFTATQQAYAEHGIAIDGKDCRVAPFIDDMAAAYAWADLVLCRAGALTVAELSAVGVASILVPYPHAVDDHQTHNGAALAAAGASVMLQQTALSADYLVQLLNRLSADRSQLLTMSKSARHLTSENAAQKVLSHCMTLLPE